MYLMIGLRPDIAYANGKLVRFFENPKLKHWIAVKQVLRYVKGTSNMWLCYDGLKCEGTFGYTDSDWAGDVSHRKSTNAHVFMMAGSSISWSWRKRSMIATSSCDVGYVSMRSPWKEAVWSNRLLSKIPLGYDFSKRVRVLPDGQSAMNLASNESTNRRNKHIDITFHYSRDVTNNVEENYYMVADMLTNPLGRAKLERLRKLCGITTKGECWSMKYAQSNGNSSLATVRKVR